MLQLGPHLQKYIGYDTKSCYSLIHATERRIYIRAMVRTQDRMQGIDTYFFVHSRAVARNFASSFFKSCNSTVEIEPAAIDQHRI